MGVFQLNIIDKRLRRTPAGALNIIEYNLNLLYHLPKKYRCLDRALKNVRADLLRLLRFCKEHEPLIIQQKYVWFIDNKRLTEKVRKKTTAATSNRYFNYLCCLGAIHKLPQGEGNLTGVNLTFLLNEQENGKTRPINTFTVYKYTPKQLEKMEARAQLLLENGITQGNISHDKLVASGCAEMAAEVYYANSDKAIVKKERDFKRLLELLSRLCNEKGHTTKRELCDLLDWRKDKLDRILGTFKKEWQQQYSYKAPNKEETEQYNLKSKAWIMTRR